MSVPPTLTLHLRPTPHFQVADSLSLRIRPVRPSVRPPLLPAEERASTLESRPIVFRHRRLSLRPRPLSPSPPLRECVARLKSGRRRSKCPTAASAADIQHSAEPLVRRPRVSGVRTPRCATADVVRPVCPGDSRPCGLPRKPGGSVEWSGWQTAKSVDHDAVRRV